jgi:hypothetical protein
MTWPNFDLELWPWPQSIGMMVTNTLVLLYTKDDVTETNNKEVEKIQFLRYDVTKWRQNVKIFLDLESTHQDLSYEVKHDMVLYGSCDFKNWPWGKQISTRSETPEGQRRLAPKINQLSGSSYATFTPSLKSIW